MQPNFHFKQSEQGRFPHRLLLSCVLPFLLFVIFLAQQFISVDGIGWSNGFSHPLTGWDHLVTMLAVGIWAAQLRGQAIWMLPLAFVGVMSLGGLAGAAGLSIPSVEGIILLSCAVFCILINRKVRFSAKINVLIVAFFAFFHGFAHGQEISTSASLVSYTLGFMLATLLLHGAGILVAKLIVLAITCLLAVMFSSAALGKTAVAQSAENRVSSEDDIRKSLPGWRSDFHFVHAEIGFSSKQSPTAINSGRIGAQLKQSPHEASRLSLSSSFPTFTYRKNFYSGDGHLHTASEQASILHSVFSASAILQWQTSRLSLGARLTEHLRLAFKQCFPDINHTPGKQLLSSGVGLTSPPIAKFSGFAALVPLVLHIFPIFCIEALSVQACVAACFNGKPVSILYFIPENPSLHRHGIPVWFWLASSLSLTQLFVRFPLKPSRLYLATIKLAFYPHGPKPCRLADIPFLVQISALRFLLLLDQIGARRSKKRKLTGDGHSFRSKQFSDEIQ